MSDPAIGSHGSHGRIPGQPGLLLRLGLSPLSLRGMSGGEPASRALRCDDPYAQPRTSAQGEQSRHERHLTGSRMVVGIRRQVVPARAVDRTAQHEPARHRRADRTDAGDWPQPVQPECSGAGPRTGATGTAGPTWQRIARRARSRDSHLPTGRTRGPARPRRCTPGYGAIPTAPAPYGQPGYGATPYGQPVYVDPGRRLDQRARHRLVRLLHPSASSSSPSSWASSSVSWPGPRYGDSGGRQKGDGLAIAGIIIGFAWVAFYVLTSSSAPISTNSNSSVISLAGAIGHIA